MKRSRLKSDPEKLRAWQERSRRKNPLRARRGLRRESRKQKETREYRRDVVRPIVVARDGEGCYAGNRGLLAEVRCRSTFPDRVQFEMHELLARSKWYAGARDPENIRLLCQAHHDYITHNPIGIERGREVGLVLRSAK